MGKLNVIQYKEDEIQQRLGDLDEGECFTLPGEDHLFMTIVNDGAERDIPAVNFFNHSIVYFPAITRVVRAKATISWHHSTKD